MARDGRPRSVDGGELVARPILRILRTCLHIPCIILRHSLVPLFLCFYSRPHCSLALSLLELSSGSSHLGRLVSLTHLLGFTIPTRSISPCIRWNPAWACKSRAWASLSSHHLCFRGYHICLAIDWLHALRRTNITCLSYSLLHLLRYLCKTACSRMSNSSTGY